MLDDIHVATNAQEDRAVDITIMYTLIATRQRERIGLTLALQA